MLARPSGSAADVWDVREHPLLDADLEVPDEHRRDELHDERRSTRQELHVVAELQVLDEGGAFREGLHCVGLEDLWAHGEP